MLKKCLLVFSLLCLIPAWAGELEDALASKDKVFLYMYTKDCSYCKKFNPIYNKVSETHTKDYAFVKIDAETPYGRNMMRQFRAGFVPYVLVMNAKQAKFINPVCLLDTACVEKELKNF